MANEIKNIWEWIFYVDSNVKFHMQMQWAVFGVTVTILGASLVILARSWFKSSINKQLKKIKREIINETANYRTTTALRDISLQGIQTIYHSNKIHALMIKCYFINETYMHHHKIQKDFLMYSENGASRDNIKIACANGAMTELKVKGLCDNGFELEWITNGDVGGGTVGLDIMIL